MRINTLILATVAIAHTCIAQDYDYQDYGDYGDGGEGYEQDSLYEEFAVKQQEKGGGAVGGFGMGKVAIASAASYILGAKIHSGRVAKAMKKKHTQDQKTLYTQYYNDVYKLEEQKTELQIANEQLQKSLLTANEEHENENLQREYDEFKQPDVDGDDQISRTEFNLYVKNYLANYPGLTEKDYPKFEDFDHDKDGQVSFQEYAQQMGVQAQQAEMDQYYAESQGKTGRKEEAKANALYDLYDSASSKHTDGFNDLYAQIRR